MTIMTQFHLSIISGIWWHNWSWLAPNFCRHCGNIPSLWVGSWNRRRKMWYSGIWKCWNEWKCSSQWPWSWQFKCMLYHPESLEARWPLHWAFCKSSCLKGSTLCTLQARCWGWLCDNHKRGKYQKVFWTCWRGWGRRGGFISLGLIKSLNAFKICSFCSQIFQGIALWDLD